MSKQGLLLIALLLHISAEAQKSFEIVVEDFRIREGFAQPTPAVSVIEAADIASSGATNVTEMLNVIPGVFVAQNGGGGQPASVFIRGSESRHTLVLLDGMELNDPLNPSRAFDFSSLSIENIERIEIYRGAQSVKFGSDAIGGVINIISKQGSGPLKAKVMLEAGSYNTLNNSAEVSGSKEKINYSFGTSLASSSGFSAADTNQGNREADSFQRVSVSGRAGKNFRNDTNFNVSLRAVEIKSDLDVSGGPNGDDPNYTSESRQFQGGAFLKTRSFSSRLSSIFGATLAYHTRSDENSPDATHPDQAANDFTSFTSKLESRNDFIISDEHSVQFGVQLRNESGHSESSFNGVSTDLPENSASTNGLYGIYKFQEDTYFTELGLRQDMRGGSGISSYSIGGGLILDKADILASLSSGFKNPSLYQLYSSFGNAELGDEKSTSAEVSIESKVSPVLAASFTYFVNKYYDLIEFDPGSSRYFNVSESSSRGSELQGSWQAGKNFLLKGRLTHLTAVNDSNGFKLLRRPDTTYSAEAEYADGNWEGALSYSFTGERSDIDPVTFLRVAMPSYDLVNLRAVYRYARQVRLSVRVVNLMNREYQSVAGFGTSEQAFFAGVSKEF